MLNAAGLPYLVGGGYALEWVTGIARRTKDLDLFVRPSDCEAALGVLAQLGCATDLTYPHWLGKARCDAYCIDVIFNSGNGQVAVDDRWFAHALAGELFGIAVNFCPIEETIWTKAFIMERERYDGADVAHLLGACAQRLDWARLLDCFGADWPVLLSHLALFGFIYPGKRTHVPAWVVRELTARLSA